MSIKQWYVLHKWSSLFCSLFLLVICISGLPLIFAEEIDDWLNPPRAYTQLPAAAPRASLDGIVAQAHQRYPGQVINSMFIDDDHPEVTLDMFPNFKADPKFGHLLRFDAHSGKLLKDDPPFVRQSPRFMAVMLALHTDLFVDLPGELFLAVMALLFVIAIVSGIVLYKPFMKKLDFGTVRMRQGRRLQWLDLHNLLGIVVAAWTLVVGATGCLNELSSPLFGWWRISESQHILAAYQGRPIPEQTDLHSVQAAWETAHRAQPGMTITGIVFPGSRFGLPQHYLLWSKGDRTLTSRLFTPTLVDGRSGKLTAVVPMPWYLRLLEVSRPLHFGDYGGLPLKMLWVLLDLLTMAVLGSGLYLWIARRQRHTARLAKIVAVHAASSASAKPRIVA